MKRQLIRLKEITTVLFTIVAVTTGLIACSLDDDTSDNAPATEMRLYVNGDRYRIPLPATEAINLKSLSTDNKEYFRIENANAFNSIRVSPFTEIAKDKQIEIAYTTGGQSGVIRINTLPAGVPDIVAEGKGVIPGHFYLSFIYQRLIMKYDNDGKITYYRYEPTTKAGTFTENGYWDFKKHVFDGKTYYSYHAPDDKFANRAFTGYNPGMRILLDENYIPVDTIHALASLDGYLPDGEPIDGHDFYFFSPKHYILSAYINREVDGKQLSVAYLQEVDNGKVVFDWWSNDHTEMATWTSTTFDTGYDYVHFNSIQVLPDGNLLCSFRHLSSLLKIDRAGGTGNIIWRIAGETLPEDQAFSGQHYATLHDDGTLTLFDNGNGHAKPVTRILRLNVDPATGNVTGGGNILNSGGDYFSQACGSLQMFGNRFTVGWGWSIEEGNNTRLITEHDADGKEVFGLHRSQDDSKPNSTNASYRCVKYSDN